MKRDRRRRRSLLDRARPYVRRVPAGVPRLIVAAGVFLAALIVEPRKTLYGSDGRHRPIARGEVFDVHEQTGTEVSRRPAERS